MHDTRVMLTKRQAREFYHLAPALLDIVSELIDSWPTQALIVTSIYRTPQEEELIRARTGYKPSGVHAAGPPFRAIDFSVRGVEPESEVERVAAHINSIWIYDPSRPRMDCVVTKLHGTGPHVHVQVHPSTAKRSSAPDVEKKEA